jgi:hypothetical protein
MTILLLLCPLIIPVNRRITEKAYYLKKISPHPSLPKRGNASLYKREGRRDLVISNDRTFLNFKIL